MYRNLAEKTKGLIRRQALRSEGVDCERNSAIRGAAENAAFSGTSRRAWLYWLAVVVASEEKLQLRKGNMFKGAKRKVGGRNNTIRILRTHYGYLGIGGSAGTGRNGWVGSYGRRRALNIYRRGFSDTPTAVTRTIENLKNMKILKI